jgi:ubiquinone/menaquinone biosynthesis C-methylase UbiE
MARFLDPQDGHILDVACGTGRWTRAIADRFGPERTIGLDLSFPMLQASRAALPGVFFVRGTAEKLPFADGALGAINCWAALQLVPHPEVALAEAARCLRPGGTWTCFTFREAEDPIYRYFQATHAPGLPTFRDEEIRAWISRYGMDVVDLSGPEAALFVTARRR